MVFTQVISRNVYDWKDNRRKWKKENWKFMEIDYIRRRYSSHSRPELTHAVLLLYSKSDFKLRDSLCGDIHDRDKNDTATLEMQQ